MAGGPWTTPGLDPASLARRLAGGGRFSAAILRFLLTGYAHTHPQRLGLCRAVKLAIPFVLILLA